jgi:CubicO group peptidase (beta-lactamase class C family)
MSLMLALLLAATIAGWALLALVLLGSGPTSEDPVLPVLLALVAATGGLAWLVGRYVASARYVALAIALMLALPVAVGTTWALSCPDPALFLARDIAWGESDVRDYQKFPERIIHNAPPVFRFKQRLSPQLFQTIEYRSEGQLKRASFDEFLKSSHTTSFIVIKDDAILYEGYFNGYNRDSIVTSFSVAKSFTSALVGIAIDEGYIESVDDRITDYLPELRGKGFDGVTIRHLLTMSSGISFTHDDDLPPLQQLWPFSDNGLSYSYPDMRSLALRVRPDPEPPGAAFNYNPYHPLLLGMILERTTHRPVAQYLEEKIWRPLGMEYPASWSLDSGESGFEKMESGINARAIDFAKFGRLFLNNGNWDGRQIISEQWIKDSTAPDSNDHRPWRSYRYWQAAGGYYKYMWWGKRKDDGGYDYMAQGHLGQWIAVSPQERVIVVRFGISDEGVDAWEDVIEGVIAKAKGGGQQTTASLSRSPRDAPAVSRRVR